MLLDDESSEEEQAEHENADEHAQEESLYCAYSISCAQLSADSFQPKNWGTTCVE